MPVKVEKLCGKVGCRACRMAIAPHADAGGVGSSTTPVASTLLLLRRRDDASVPAALQKHVLALARRAQQFCMLHHDAYRHCAMCSARAAHASAAQRRPMVTTVGDLRRPGRTWWLRFWRYSSKRGRILHNFLCTSRWRVCMEVYGASIRSIRDPPFQRDFGTLMPVAAGPEPPSRAPKYCTVDET